MGSLYVIEMPPEWRQGRGRYWLPGGDGYTNDIARAGRWPVEHPHIQGLLEYHAKVPDRLWSRAVPLDEALREAT